MRQKRHKTYELTIGCAVEACLEVLGGKWKGVILHHLMTRAVLRFNEIQRLKPSLSPRVLTAQLRALEKDGVIVRNVYPVVPPRIEYSLSQAGESLRSLLKAMESWETNICYVPMRQYVIGPRYRRTARNNRVNDSNPQFVPHLHLFS